MKKILTLSIILCMIFVSLLAFSSCSVVTDVRMKFQGQEVVADAMKNTTDKFFSVDKKTNKIIEAAGETGSVEINLEAAPLEELADIEQINEKIYFNKEAKKAATETKVVYDGNEFALNLFVDQKGYVINGESVLGSDKSYAIYPATLSESLIESELGDMLFAEMDEEALEDVAEALEQFAKSYKEAFETDDKEQKKKNKELFATLRPITDSEKVTNDRGREVTATVVIYTINNDTIESFIKKFAANSNMDETEFENMIEDLLDQLDEMTIDLKLKYYLNFLSTSVTQVALVGEIEVDEQEIEVDALITYGKTEILCNAALEIDGEEGIIKYSIKKTAKGDETKYDILLAAKSGGVTVDLIEATVNYNEESGAFEMELSLGESLSLTTTEDEELAPMELTVKGSLKTGEDNVVFAVDSVKAGDETIKLNLKITVKAEDTMPAFPADAEDVVDLTQKDIEEIVESFMEGDLGKLISGLTSSENPMF